MASRLRRVARHVTGSAVTAPVAFGPPDGPAEGDELALLEEVLEYNTPQITNVVATYPAQKTNLGLYNPWLTNWYCDNTMKCCFPEHGRKCGYAVTCIWGPPRDGFDRVSWIDVLKALEVNRANGRPSALIIKQDFPEEYANKVGLVGGNMANAMKVLGVVGCISDGPIRDLDEVTAFCPLPPPALSRRLSLWPVSSELTRGSVFYRSHTLALSVLSLCLCLYCPQLRELGMHFHSMGTSAGHGEFGVYAVNTPVHVCGMDVAPGELVHMDENGVCKFPADKLDAVVDNCKELQGEEDITLANVKEATNFRELMNAMSGRTPYDDGPKKK